MRVCRYIFRYDEFRISLIEDIVGGTYWCREEMVLDVDINDDTVFKTFQMSENLWIENGLIGVEDEEEQATLHV